MASASVRTDILILTNPKSTYPVLGAISRSWGRYLSSDERRKENTVGKDRLPRKRRNRSRIARFDGEHFHKLDDTDFEVTGQLYNKNPDFGILAIDQKQAYKSLFENYNLKATYLFIVPELGWNNDEGQLEGYELAQELVNMEFARHFLQIEFFSFLNTHELLSFVNSKYRRFVQALPHHNILKLGEYNLSFKPYSNVHYELIRHLVFPVEASIDYAIHELDGYLRPIRLSDDSTLKVVKKQVTRVFEDLEYLENISEISVNTTRENVLETDSPNEIEKIIDQFKNELQSFALQYKLQNQKETKPRSNYKVLIVEDENESLRLFSESFSKIFSRVYPSPKEISTYSLSNIYEDIKDIASDYDVFILDLLYKDKNDNWLSFNGLELYQQIKRYNPYAVIRVITALPRDVIARVAEKILDQEIPFSHIFTKTKGKETLRHSIFDRADEIIQECIKKEKEKRFSEKLPDVGFFSQPGVYEYLKELLTYRRDRFNEILTITQNNFGLYDRGELSKDTPGWRNGQLPGPNTFKPPFNPHTLLKVLPNVLTHRLFVLDNLDEKNRLNIDRFAERIGGLVNFTNFERPYLTTKLGFNYISINSSNSAPSVSKNLKMIKLINLFKHEFEFIQEKNQENQEDIKLNKLHQELSQWISATFSIDEVKRSLSNIEFESAYLNKLFHEQDGEVSGFSVDSLQEFILELSKQLDNEEARTISEYLEEGYDQLSSNAINTLPPKAQKIINNFFFKTLADYY